MDDLAVIKTAGSGVVAGKLRALIFDFDGLILDTEYPDFASWQEIFAEFGQALSLEEWALQVGKDMAEIPRTPYQELELRLGRPLDHNEIRVRRRTAFQKRMAHEVALPGVETLISEARASGLRLGIASNSSREWVVGYLETLGLYQQFDAIRCGDEVERPKPAPDVYLAVLNSLDVRAKDAVAFEDSAHGAVAAKAAGLNCVVVPNKMTRHSPPATADLHADSLTSVSVDSLVRRFYPATGNVVDAPDGGTACIVRSE